MLPMWLSLEGKKDMIIISTFYIPTTAYRLFLFLTILQARYYLHCKSEEILTQVKQLGQGHTINGWAGIGTWICLMTMGEMSVFAECWGCAGLGIIMMSISQMRKDQVMSSKSHSHTEEDTSIHSRSGWPQSPSSYLSPSCILCLNNSKTHDWSQHKTA